MFAIFNPDREQPPGGFCLSVFIVARKDYSSCVLVGKIAEPKLWETEWGLDLKHPDRWKDRWQIPATYLTIGNHPDKVAVDLCRRQIGAKEEIILTTPRIFTSGGPSSLRPGTVHQDLFFVYDVEIKEELEKPLHFSEFEFVDPSRLQSLNFGRGHEEVLHLCKIY